VASIPAPSAAPRPPVPEPAGSPRHAYAARHIEPSPRQAARRTHGASAPQVDASSSPCSTFRSLELVRRPPRAWEPELTGGERADSDTQGASGSSQCGHCLSRRADPCRLTRMRSLTCSASVGSRSKPARPSRSFPTGRHRPGRRTAAALRARPPGAAAAVHGRRGHAQVVTSGRLLTVVAWQHVRWFAGSFPAAARR